MLEKHDPRWTIEVPAMTAGTHVFLEFPKGVIKKWELLSAKIDYGYLNFLGQIEYYISRKDFWFDLVKPSDLLALRPFQSFEVRYDDGIVVLTRIYTDRNATEMLANSYKVHIQRYEEHYHE